MYINNDGYKLVPILNRPVLTVYYINPRTNDIVQVECFLAEKDAQDYFLDFWLRQTVTKWIEWH